MLKLERKAREPWFCLFLMLVPLVTQMNQILHKGKIGTHCGMSTKVFRTDRSNRNFCFKSWSARRVSTLRFEAGMPELSSLLPCQENKACQLPWASMCTLAAY